MNCKIEIIPRLLHFKQPAGTSEEHILRVKFGIFILPLLTSLAEWGIGECAPLPALSCDDLPDYEDILVKSLPESREGTRQIGYGWLV